MQWWFLKEQQTENRSKLCVSAGCAGDEDKALQSRMFAIREIVSTEQDYIQDLGLIVNGYIPLMRDPKSEIKIPKDLRDGKEKLIFCNIEQIYKWHNEWVQTLVFSLVNNLCNLYLSNKSMIHHGSPRDTLYIFLNISTKAERILCLYRLPHFKIKLSYIIYSNQVRFFREYLNFRFHNHAFDPNCRYKQ